MPTPNGAFGARQGCGKVPTVGLLQQQSGLGWVCRPGLALEAEKHDVGLRSDTQLVK
jgi:hypothetical protein